MSEELKSNEAASRAQLLAFCRRKGPRAAVLKVLADSIVLASRFDNDRWGLTLQPNLVRLNVGKIEVVSLWQEGVHFMVDGDDLLRRWPEEARTDRVRWRDGGVLLLCLGAGPPPSTSSGARLKPFSRESSKRT